jgi:transposase
MNVRYRVDLSQIERTELRALLSGGKHASRKLKRAQILLAADAGASDEEIARSVGVGGSTVYRTKRRFVEGNLERALSEEPRPGAERKLTGKEEALLVATACASPPKGRARWTLDLLAGAMVKLTEHKSLSHETVRRRLAENGLKPWRKDMWCIPQVDGEYVARMEDVLDLYAAAPDPKRPVVCFDESPVQLIGEARQPIPAAPGRLERYDYEYRRNGTVNLFVLLDVHRPWRKVKVTARRAAEDYASCMRDLVDVHYPTPRSSGSSRTIYRPTLPALSIRRSRRPTPDGFCGGSSSTTPPNTQAGSTWSRSRSASCGASAWIAGSTIPSAYAAKSPPGSGREMPPSHASNGCSQQTRPAPKWAAPIPLLPKSHNHCAEPLVSRIRPAGPIAASFPSPRPSLTSTGRSIWMGSAVASTS